MNDKADGGGGGGVQVRVCETRRDALDISMMAEERAVIRSMIS